MHAVAFEPKGDIAEWQLILDRLVKLKVGDVITYEELTTILGRDFLQARGPFHKANKRLLETKKRGLLNVKNTGYRVVTSAEHELAARDQHRYANRRLRSSRRWLTNTDRSDLAPEVAERFDRLEQSLDRQIDFTRKLDRRVANVEKALKASRSENAESASATSERLTKLVAALERHGIDVD